MSTIWSDTISLTLLGMTTVFVFLLLLVICLKIMSTIIASLGNSEEDTLTNDKELAAVAAIAFKRHQISRDHS